MCFLFLSPTMSHGSSSPSMGLQQGKTKSATPNGLLQTQERGQNEHHT